MCDTGSQCKFQVQIPSGRQLVQAEQLVQAWHCNCVMLHLYDIATVLSHRAIGGLVLHLYDIATVLPHRAIGGLVHHLYDIATIHAT